MEDPRQLALKIFEAEKRLLLEDKDEYSAADAVVVSPEGNYWEELEFNDEEGKIEAYTGLTARAKENHAEAIITINTSRRRALIDGAELGSDYWWGMLESEDCERSLTLTLTGPGIQALCLTLPYKLEGDNVVFGQAGEFEPAIINLLPNWP